jgi:hypothetical protein
MTKVEEVTESTFTLICGDDVSLGTNRAKDNFFE